MDIEGLKNNHSNSYLFDINKINTLIINSLILYLKYNFYIFQYFYIYISKLYNFFIQFYNIFYILYFIKYNLKFYIL